LEALARDYAAMQPMFLRTPPAFDEVIQQLAGAEQAINSM
jgi:hypothetical protein